MSRTLVPLHPSLFGSESLMRGPEATVPAHLLLEVGWASVSLVTSSSADPARGRPSTFSSTAARVVAGPATEPTSEGAAEGQG